MLRQPDPPNIPKAEKAQRDAKAQKLYYEYPQILTRNLKQYNEELKIVAKKQQEGCQIHKMQLTKLYNKDTFVHYNQCQGLIQVYRLGIDKVQKNPNTISLDPTIDHIIQISDNLLVITNLSTGLCSIYDNKSIYKLREPLCNFILYIL